VPSPAQQALAFAPASSLSGSQPRLPSAWSCPVHRDGFHLVMWKPLCLAARVSSSRGLVAFRSPRTGGLAPCRRPPPPRVWSRVLVGWSAAAGVPCSVPEAGGGFRLRNPSILVVCCPRCPGGLAPGRCRRLGGSVARQVLASRPAGPPVAWRALVVGVALGPPHFVRTSSSEVGLLPGLP
jgi:hypothetical protein